MDSKTPIAIIGIGCRFPGGANTPEKLWKLLVSGHDTWTSVPSTRWNEDAFFHPDPDIQGMYNHRGGHFLDQDIAAFDGNFFGLSPIECEAMDPQQRIQLEVAYESLENAGIPIQKIEGSQTAVFVATFSSDYSIIQHKDCGNFPKYHTTGTGLAIIPNRISYQFDLRGPSVAIDTGCSGGMVSIHQACLSLRSGECDMALAGGVNLMLSPDQMSSMSLMRCWNEDGKCYSFDDRGTGYGRGEGAAMVVLKRLDDAVRDGNCVRAIIRNSGVNQDGKTAGIMVPKVEAQQNLITSLYDAVGLDPSDTDFVEAHGTGTAVGDPVEVDAIRLAFSSVKRNQPLSIGTIKPNIGHLESASGVAGLIKAVLMLEHGQFPPTIGIKTLKPSLNLDTIGIEIPEYVKNWPDDRVRRISVNSFGYGGTNAHVILEEAPHYSKNGEYDNQTLQILPFSGATKATASNLVSRFQQWAADNSPGSSGLLQDVALTLSQHRSTMQYRVAVSVTSIEDMAARLQRENLTPTKVSSQPRLIFIFTGQGAQWYAMGRELITLYSIFRRSLEMSAEDLKALGADWSLLEELSKDENTSRINEGKISQSATTALQIALVDLLYDVGVTPDVVVGHSSGEIAAAYASGALNRTSALKVAYSRGKLIRRPGLNKGAMVAVGLGEEEAAQYLTKLTSGKAIVACSNSPLSSTISGDEEAITQVEKWLENDGVFRRRLVVDQAYHSHHMLELAEQYMFDLKNHKYETRQGTGTFVSSVTGAEETSVLGPKYWVKNLISKVQFSDALIRALSSNIEIGQMSVHHIIIEIGPHNALAGPVRQIIAANFTNSHISQHATLQRGKNSVHTFANLATYLFERCDKIDLGRVNALLRAQRPVRILNNLPTYPWDHSVKYWHESYQSREHRLRKHPYHDLVGVRVPAEDIMTPEWRYFPSLFSLPWLRDHQIDGGIIFPASGYACMVIEALQQIADISGTLDKVVTYELKSLTFVAPAIVPESGNTFELKLRFHPTDTSDWRSFRIVSVENSNIVTEHCRGHARLTLKHEVINPERYWSNVKFTPAQPRAAHGTSPISEEIKVNINQFYYKLGLSGNHYGPGFSILEDLRIHGTDAYASIRVPDMAKRMPCGVQRPHLIHPTVLDALLHPSIALFQKSSGGKTIVTASIDSLAISPSIPKAHGANVKFTSSLRNMWAQTCLTDIEVVPNDDFRSHGRSPLQLHGLGLKSLKSIDTDADSRRDMSYQMHWELDADFLSANDIKDLREGADHEAESQAIKLQQLNQASSIYIGRCLEDLHTTHESNDDIPNNHRQLLKWMTEFWEGNQCRALLSGIDKATTDDCLARAASLGIEGEVLTQIGGNLTSILRGRLDPLSLITERDLLWRLYADDASVRCYGFVVKYLQHLCFKRPNMAVLEIGAGTGGATEPILEALASNGRFPFRSYEFTDVSSAFFEKAKKRLNAWKDHISYRKLDMQADVIEQSFEAGMYDVLLASNVLHVATSIPSTLSQLRKLLRPGGRIIMIETTRNVPFYNTCLGVLPGWWAGLRDGRSNGPFLSEEQWDQTLEQTGFTGAGLIVRDFEGPSHRCAMIVSKPLVCNMHGRPSSFGVEILLCPTWQARQPIFCSTLTSKLAQTFGKVTVGALSRAQISWGKVYIILDDGSKPSLTASDPILFKAITHLLSNASWVFWITVRGDTMSIGKDLITGFIRGARAENPSLTAITMDVQDNAFQRDGADSFSLLVQTLVTRMLAKDTDQNLIDLDYVLQNGRLYIARIISDTDMNLAVARATGQLPHEAQKFHQANKVFRLAVEKACFLDNPEFQEDETVHDDLDPTQLKVNVQAWGVNFKDMLIAGGRFKKQVAMAGEYSGVVIEVGAHYEDKYVIGDRVCGFGATPYASQIRVKGDTVAKLPDCFSFTSGSSLPVVYATAYHALVNIAKIASGQKVLIHSAAGGLGQAAIAVAQWSGAEIFATVSSMAKKDFLMSNWNIAEDHIFSSRTESFKDEIMLQTQGVGVDLVLNTLSGRLLHASMECTAPFGIFLELGKWDIHSGTQISMGVFDSNITVTSIDLASIQQSNPSMTRELIHKVLSMIEKQELSGLKLVTVLPLNQIKQAFRNMQDRERIGKIVLDSGPDSLVDAPRRRVCTKYCSNATYIIAGGLGGLGLEITKYLVKNGARHILLLTRKHPADVISIPGAAIHVLRCDITDMSEIERHLIPCLRSMPPVKGLFQSAMVLRDCILGDMTSTEFLSCIAPKVDGTQNLIEALKEQHVQWIVLLSSVVGAVIGTVAEANYAAANAYLNSLARSRRSQHPRIIAVAPGVIDDVGVLSRDHRVKQILEKEGFPAVKATEVIALIDYALSDESQARNISEIVFGFDQNSLRSSENNTVLNNPIFSHILRTGVNKDIEEEELSRERSLTNTRTPAEAEELIIEGLLKKIGTLVAMDEAQIDRMCRIDKLGMDSLVIILVKNWIAQEFEVTLQNSEVIGASNLKSLAKIIASRLPLRQTNLSRQQTSG